MENAMKVVTEQFDQIAASYAASASVSQLIMYIVTIGQSPNEPRLQQLCAARNLHCQHVQHYDRAFEEVTLHHLYQHCQNSSISNKDDNNLVVYFHSKGSYHDNPTNKHWRKHLLNATTISELCLDRPRHDNCNVCGLQFYPLWTQLFPGNFFTAKCSYIRQLVPPLELEQRLDRVSAVIRHEYGFQTTLLVEIDLFLIFMSRDY